MAMVTDYDCWKVDEAHVTVEMIIANLNKNAEMAKRIVTDMLARIPDAECKCHHALKNAIMTAPSHWPKTTAKKLAPLLAKYRG
jgi:5'-methylthioadenosine phosphorylase